MVCPGGWGPQGLTSRPILRRLPRRHGPSNSKATKGAVRTTTHEKNDWKVLLLDVFQPNVLLRTLRCMGALAFIVAGDRDVIMLAHTVAIYCHLPCAWFWVGLVAVIPRW